MARARPEVQPDGHLGLSVAAAILAAGIVYCTLPAVGLLLFGELGKGMLALGGAAACAAGVVLLMRHMGWGQVVE